MAATATHPIQHAPAHKPASKLLDSRTLFLLGLLIAGSGIVSPPVALVGGIAFGFTVEHPLRAESARLSKLLLQASVIALGFGMNILQVAHAGSSGFAYTAISITTAMILGLLLGKLLRVGGKASYLITAGTAICGGSAIAAMGPVLAANEEEMAVSLGTVFVLNSVALLLFPFIGWALHLSQTQFGLWSALAIHDTSSVVGAGARYGATALAVGTTVKLARALWIVPLTIATAMLRKSDAKIQWPWFIFYFVLAAIAASYVPHWLPKSTPLFASLNHLGRAGLTVVLFLIGTGISRATLRQVGARPLIQGITLWIAVATVSLWAIHAGLIAL
jgi:uncharacterized integral membrane protein (TIGR00698 family)